MTNNQYPMCKIITSLLLVLFFSSCRESIKTKQKNLKNEKIETTNSAAAENKAPNNQEQKSKKKSLFSKVQIDKQSQFFMIDPNRDTFLICDEKTSLKIRANSFRNKISKKEITTPIKLSIQEYYRLNDIVLANLTTTSGNNLLETGGMVYLTAISNDKECEIREDSPIEIGFPYTRKKEGMQLFMGDRSTDDVIDWRVDIDSTNLSQEVIAVPDVDASFPGGQLEFYKFLAENLEYPPSLMDEGFSGKVYIKFVVTNTGEIQDVTIEKGNNSHFNKIAIDFVKKMPKWIPAQSNGRNVSSYYRIPINFKLNNDANVMSSSISPSPTKIITNQNIAASTAYEINRYFLNTTKLGWINCDRFISERTPKVDVKFYLTGNAMMIFHASKSILPSYKIDDQQVFSNVPINEKVTIIALKKVDQQLFIGLKTTFITGATEIDSIEFKPTSFEELKEEMKKLEVIKEAT